MNGELPSENSVKNLDMQKHPSSLCTADSVRAPIDYKSDLMWKNDQQA